MINEKTTYNFYDNYKSYQEAMTERRENLLNEMETQNKIDSKSKIIKLLELEYDDLEKQQFALIYSNDEMLNSDPNDIQLIEYRSENMKYIGHNFERMKQIIDEVAKLDSNHHFKDKDIFTFNSNENHIEPSEINTLENKEVSDNISQDVQLNKEDETIEPIYSNTDKKEHNDILQELEL